MTPRMMKRTTAAAAQFKLNELHRARGAENAAAEKHFDQLCRAFAEQAIQEQQP